LKIHFLGTGTSQGIPVIGIDHPVCFSSNPKDKRLRVSVWIECEGSSIVIDCGPDFRQQMLSSGCQRVDGILFTHEHADHTAGLDDIRPFYFKQGNIDVFGHERVLNNLFDRFQYIFDDENKYPGAPSVNSHIIFKNQSFKIGNLNIIPIEVWHGNWQVFGFRLNNFAYLTDVKTIEKDQLSLLRGIEILVINVLRETPHPTHLNLEEAMMIIEQLKPKKTYFTHISHHFGFHDDIQEKLPNGIFVAYDGLIINS
jgi:phosphoribosyl 1,2-cyclic phosphate phosphodiesterase